jgi:hypothetical protein
MTDVYVARTGVDRADLLAMLNAETWLSATQAVEKGFATRVEENSQPVAASLRGKTAIINGVEMDLSRFKNAPKLPEEKDDKSTDTTSAALWKEIESLKALVVTLNAKPNNETPAPQPEANLSGLELEMRRLSLLAQTI